MGEPLLKDTDKQINELKVIDFDKEELVDSERLQIIEQDLISLSSLMSSIREMVIYQAPEIDYIEANIKLAKNDIDKGVEEIEVAQIYQQRSTRRKIKVVSGAVIGGLLFGGIGVAVFGVTQGLLAVGVGSSAGAFTGLIS